MTTRFRLRRAITAAALVVPIVGSAVVATPAAQAATDPKPIASAADWVTSQLTNGLVVGQYGADVGLSIDAATALQAAGRSVTTIRNAVEPQATDYYRYVDTTTTPNQTTNYANSLAKLLVFVQSTGGTPTSFNGQNLVTNLNALVGGNGRVADNTTPTPTPAPTDYASTIGQAYTARGLATAGSGKATLALTYLLNQQCNAGYFSLTMADTGCQATGATADPDVTSLAVLQLTAMPQTGAVPAALAKAKVWLESQQKPDGSFGGGPSTPGSNANSTGLAGSALAGLGDATAAQRAAIYVRSLQVHQPATCTDALSNAQGTIGYDATTLGTGRYNGLGNATVLDKFRRSTTQGLLVLGSAPAGSGAISAPKVFARSKKATTVSVAGVAPGDSVCLTGPGLAKLATAGTDGVASVSVTAPKSGRAVYTLADSAGHSTTATLRVLPNKRLKVYAAKKRIKRGAGQYISVSGLAVGEPVRFRLYGKTITRTANAKGKAAITFKAGKRLRTVKVSVFGRFGGVRHGSNTFKVVR